MTGSADRSAWPPEAVALAESCDLPGDSIFYRVISWPPVSAYDDGIVLPRQPRGERTWRWCPVKVHTGKRPNKRVWLFAMKWPERPGVIESGGTEKRDIFLPTTDPMERPE